MSRSWLKFATVVVALSLFGGMTSTALAQKGGVRKVQKKPDPPPLPAYTPGPLPPMPLDQLPAVAPKVSFQGGQLTIQAHNSTLADVLKEIRQQIGADFDVPSNATERVVANLGPGPARDVLTELLNGTHFNYVIVGSLTDPTAVRNVLLTPKTAGAETASAAPPAGMPQRGIRAVIPQTPPEAEEDTPNDADDDPNPPDRDAQDAQAGQPDQNQSQQTPKTPEQLLQELQQRQQQMQQGQQPGQQPPGQQPPNGQVQPGLFPNQPPTAENPSPRKPD